MTGEAGSLGRTFVEIHVPVESFQARMGAVGSSFASNSSKMIAEAQLVSAAIGSANAGIISSYNAVATSVMGLLTAQEMAILSTNNLSLALHHGDVIMRSTAAGGVLVGTGMTAAAVGTKGFTLSLTSLMVLAKSVLPLMAAFMAVSKTIGIAGGAVESQREFNKELYQLWTLTDLTSGGIENLGEEIRGLVYDYNVFAAAGTKAMYQIYSATFYAADATEILETGMKAAAAGVSDVMAAVDMTTTVLNAYGMAASEATRVNDLLFTAVRYGKTTYSELAGQFGRLAGVAAPAGARLEEMTAAIATLTRQGIMTDWAVTSLRQTIMSMFRPTGKLAGVIKALGYETGRSLIQQNGFVGALKMVKEKADATGIPLENLFTNVRAITAVLPLLTTASEGFALDMERTAMATGTMDIAFQKVEQSWDYRIERLKSQLNDLGLSFGEMLIPAVESFLEVWASIAGGIEGVIDLLGPLGEMIAAVAGQMAAGATAAGVLAGGIWLVYKALMALNAHPVIAGISVAVTMLAMLANKWGDIAKETDDATDAIDRYMKKRALFEGGGNEPEGTAGDVPAGTLGERLDAGGSIPMGATLNFIESLSAGRMIYNKPVGADITPQISQIATILIKEIETRMNEWIASDVSTPGTIDQNELKIIHDVLTTSATVMGPLEEADFAQEVAAAFGVELSEVLSNDPLWGVIGEGIKVGETFGGLEGQRAPAPGFTDVPTGTLATIDEINQARAEADQTLLRLLNDAALVIEPNITQFKMSIYEASKQFEALWISIQNGTVVVGEGESEMDAYLGAWEDMNSILETSKDWLEKISGVEDINEDDMAFLDSIIEFMQAVVGEESTFITETRALIKEYEAAGEGTARQAELIQKLSGRYSTAIGLQEALALVGIEADASLLKIIEDTYKFKDAVEDLSGAVEEAIQGLAGIATEIATAFGGEKATVWSELVTVLAGLGTALNEYVLKPLVEIEKAEGKEGIATGITGVASAINPYLGMAAAGIGLILSIGQYINEQKAAEDARMQAEEEARLESLLAASDAVSSAFWNLVESAESVAEIQSGLAQLQVTIMSALLGFLWPLASVLGSINELFAIQEEVIKKEVTTRQALLSSLNVPIGFPINRIRYAAGTPGEPVTFNESETGSESEQAVKEILDWWQEAMEPFRNEILEMIQPIAEFRDRMREVWIDLFPDVLSALEPVLETFGWALSGLADWIEDVFAKDMKKFFKGFGDWWKTDVDPFLKSEVFPKLAEWGLALWEIIEDIVGFLETTVWPFVENTLWPLIEEIGGKMVTLLGDVVDKILEHWPVIEAYILGAIEDWATGIETQVDEFIELADAAALVSEALDPYNLGIYDLEKAFGAFGVGLDDLVDAMDGVDTVQGFYDAMFELGLTTENVRSILDTLGLSASDVRSILESYQSLQMAAATEEAFRDMYREALDDDTLFRDEVPDDPSVPYVPHLPPVVISGGLTSEEIAAIIRDHGGRGGVFGSTGQWVPYTTWNGVPVEQLGAGGIAMSATPVVVGDVPEAIIPLNQLANMLSTQPSAAGMAGVGGFGGGIGSSAITINVNLSQERLSQILIRKMTSANVNDNGVGFAPIRVG